MDALARYWAVCPQPRQALLDDLRPAYLRLAVDKTAIKATIYEHPEFAAFMAGMESHFTAWRTATAALLKALQPGFHPKAQIAGLDESRFARVVGKPQIQPMPSTCFRRKSIGDIWPSC